MQRSLLNKILAIWPSNHTFPLLSVTREGESLCETKEQWDELDKLLVA